MFRRVDISYPPFPSSLYPLPVPFLWRATIGLPLILKPFIAVVSFVATVDSVVGSVAVVIHVTELLCSSVPLLQLCLPLMIYSPALVTC